MKTLYETSVQVEQNIQLNERSKINMKGRDNGCPYNKYYAYVSSENTDGFKFPHFHIEDKANGMNYRFNPDGSFNSIKNKGNDKESAKKALIAAAQNLVSMNKYHDIDMKTYITELWYATND